MTPARSAAAGPRPPRPPRPSRPPQASQTPPPPPPLPFRKSKGREYLESIVIAVILALFVRTWIVQAFTIPTGSMEHNLLIGDYLLVNKFVFAPTLSGAERAVLPASSVARGDIIVFKFPRDPGRDFIKRVVGLPGETLEVRRGTVYIDGRRLDEPYLRPPAGGAPTGVSVIAGRDDHPPVVIPAGHYFMMGDNRGNSEDSRVWGPLPHDHIKGRALVIYWSYDAGPPVVLREPGLAAALRRVGSAAAGVVTGTRWDRLLRPVR